MNNLFKKKTENKSKSVVSNILKLLGIDSFNHEETFSNWVAENNANLLNVPIKTAYSKIDNYLVESNFYQKNWLSLKEKSKAGISAYVIFAIENNLFFQQVNLSTRIYDVTGKLIEATIFYQPYEKNNIQVLLYETYKLVNDTVEIERYFNEIKDNEKNKRIDDKDFNDYILNPNLTSTQVLAINYLPIVPMKNKPNEKSDCELVKNKISTLDTFFEQIILDIVINSPKFLFLNTYGNQQTQVETAVKKLVMKNYFFVEEAKTIEILEGTFKGKSLTDIADWMLNEINKQIFFYNPKSETNNIEATNAITQKILQYKTDIFNFLNILIKFDQDLLNNQTFGITEKTTLENLKLEIDLINPRTKQSKGEENDTKSNSNF